MIPERQWRELPSTTRSRIVILTPHYLPGYRGGGPIQSLANLVERLGDDFEFLILTKDRDAWQKGRYRNIDPGSWQPMGRAVVLYLHSRVSPIVDIVRILRAVPYDVLYINSLFAQTFSAVVLLLRRFGVVPTTPVVLAPRGELARGALAHKARKKRTYVALSQALRLYEGVLWHATNPKESAEIESHFGTNAAVRVAPNLTQPASRSLSKFRRQKDDGRVRMVFVSRVVPKKNLLGALEILMHVAGEVLLDVYGPLEDTAYWERCRAMIDQLPPNASVRYCGELPHDEVGTTIAGYDAFFLPTLGENFGHVIFEALLAETPVVISDRTPWRGLARLGAGWDLAVEEPTEFVSVIERLVAMPDEEHRLWSQNAGKLAREYQEDPVPVAQTRELFKAARGSNG
jgi:glycosyltransferase involved in cell wall biosynthesis